MTAKFYKYTGLGNDYLVYDSNKNKLNMSTKAIETICSRNYGLGSDGILEGPLFDENGKICVKIYNPDGSIAEKSGNGVRIFSKYLKDAGYVTGKEFTLGTDGGDVYVRFNNDDGTDMTVSMGKLSFNKYDIGCVDTPVEVVGVPLTFGGKTYSCTCVSVGNPHCVIPMEEVSKEKICAIGRYSENAGYFPERVNTQIIRVLGKNDIQMEIYERGAGYTLSSGTSSCAAAGAAVRLGLTDRDVTVHMPGGELMISIDCAWNVEMTGKVSPVGGMVLSEEFMKENGITH